MNCNNKRTEKKEAILSDNFESVFVHLEPYLTHKRALVRVLVVV